MDKYQYIIYAIVSIASIIGVILLFKYKAQKVMNVLLRAFFGIAGIYLTNAILSSLHIVSMVGVNSVTIVTVTLLGVPGLLLLYGVGVFFNMI